MEHVKALEYANSQEAWEGINEYFLNNSKEIVKRGGGRYGPQLISPDMFIKIRKSWVDPKFDFGNMFGYRKQKWTSLVNNYINLDFLDILKAEVLEKIKKKTPSYNLSMPFDNSHGSGKNCLLSLTVSQRTTMDHPVITFHLRSSEVTKRLLWDLLLVQRISEYIFGEKQHTSIHIFCGNVYQNTEAFIMYDNHRKIKDLIHVPKGKEMDTWQERAIRTLKEFKEVDPKTVKFKVHLRSVRQIQRPNGIPLSGDRPLYAGDCHIFEKDDTPYPEDCISLSDRKKFKAKHKRKNRK
jgi:hypothetical protein